MDRLVKADVKEVNLMFTRGQKSTAMFKLTNLMHTMSVAVSLSTTNQSCFSFSRPFSILPPLSTSTFTLHLSPPSDRPPLSSPPDSILVRSSMLPTGKAHQDDLRRLFSRPGCHIFKDATIPILLIGSHVIEFLLHISTPSQTPEFDFLLSKSISGCDKSHLTSLLKSATVSGNFYFLLALIDAGADVNYRDSDGKSLISLAVQSGNVDSVRALIESDFAIDNLNDQFLHDAAEMERLDLVEVLCQGIKEIDVNSVDSYGRTALHIAAIRGRIEVLQFLVSMGCDPDAVDCNGWTPLHFAAAKGHEEAIEFLLNCSNFVKYSVTKDSKTAFALAFEKGHSHLYDTLQLSDVLHRAARVGDVPEMKRCLSQGAKVNGRDQNGWTPLHRAAFKGRSESVKFLLSHGAQVDLVDDFGYTSLQRAVESGHTEVAISLIAHGAKANALKSIKNVEVMIPFNLDCFKSHPSVVTPLCQEKERA